MRTSWTSLPSSATGTDLGEVRDLPEGGHALAELEKRMDPSARERLRPYAAAGVSLLAAAAPGQLRVAFTSRGGGVSPSPYASLNLGARQGDDPEHVDRNRARVLRALRAASGQAPRELVSPFQEHGQRVCGISEYHRESVRAPCDGLVVNPRIDQGLVALLLFADCVPVVLIGEVDGAVVHGGWRGLLGGVVQQGARAMTAPPGTAYIGPSIGPCCYQVDDELARAFSDRYGPSVVLPRDGGPHLDLWETATLALAEVEVPRARVVNPRLCTSCNRDLFYSHRVEGPATGRHAALLWAAGAAPSRKT